MKKVMTLVALSSILVMAGCNTVRGVGQDVSKAGDKVSQTADKTQERIQQN